MNPNPFNILKNSRGLIPFFVLGDPAFEESLFLIKTAIDAGADALELGLPFSDPIADGPIIQRANERALKHMNFAKAEELIREIRAYSDIPINLLSYANPLYRLGYESAIQRLKNCGIHGLLVADVPLEESRELTALLEKYDLKQSFLIAPNTEASRAVMIHQQSTAFTYCVNRLGTTGMNNGVSSEIMLLLTHLNHVAPETPRAVGFGIHTPAQAQQLFSAGADAVIVGSQIIAFIEAEKDQTKRLLAIENYIKEFKREIHS